MAHPLRRRARLNNLCTGIASSGARGNGAWHHTTSSGKSGIAVCPLCVSDWEGAGCLGLGTSVGSSSSASDLTVFFLFFAGFAALVLARLRDRVNGGVCALRGAFIALRAFIFLVAGFLRCARFLVTAVEAVAVPSVEAVAAATSAAVVSVATAVFVEGACVRES